MDESLYLGTVIVAEVMIRTGPGLNFPSISHILKNGDRITITATQKDGDRVWGKHQSGWSCLINKGERYIDYQVPPKLQIRARSVLEGAASSDMISSENSTTTPLSSE